MEKFDTLLSSHTSQYMENSAVSLEGNKYPGISRSCLFFLLLYSPFLKSAQAYHTEVSIFFPLFIFERFR